MTAGSLTPYRSVIHTAPTSEPITTAEAKLHLRVTHSRDNDYIDALIKSAREQVEEMTARSLMAQTWYLYRDRWPDGDRIRLPHAPVTSVTSIKYTDTAETQTTVTAGDYALDANATPPEIVLDYGKSWPSASLWPKSPIEVIYVTGYASAAAVPARLKSAMYLLISEAYEFREPKVTGTIVATVRSVNDLVGPYVVEWF